MLPGGKTANLLRMQKNSDKSVSRASLLLSLSAGASKEAMDARTRRKLGRFIFCTPFAVHEVLFRWFAALSVDDAIRG
jgi:hypothetical protein